MYETDLPHEHQSPLQIGAEIADCHDCHHQNLRRQHLELRFHGFRYSRPHSVCASAMQRSSAFSERGANALMISAKIIDTLVTKTNFIGHLSSES